MDHPFQTSKPIVPFIERVEDFQNERYFRNSKLPFQLFVSQRKATSKEVERAVMRPLYSINALGSK